MKRIFLVMVLLSLCMVDRVCASVIQEEEKVQRVVSVTEPKTESTKTGVLLANEQIVMEARHSSMNFEEIEVSKAIRLIVEERTTGNIIIRAPRSVMPYVSLSVRGGKFYATLLSGISVSRNSNVIAEVYIPNNGRINEISASSSARVKVEPNLMCEELELNTYSASAIEVNAQAEDISIEASGASVIKAVVDTAELDVELSGASKLLVSGVSDTTEVEVSGASVADMAELESKRVSVEVSGASKVKAKGLVSVSVSASGASKADVFCNGILTAAAGGASKVLYDGDCKVNIVSNTGASSIIKK